MAHVSNFAEILSPALEKLYENAYMVSGTSWYMMGEPPNDAQGLIDLYDEAFPRETP